MAMVNCKECRREISSKATACPHCGVKIKRTSIITKAALGLVIFAVISGMFFSSKDREEDAKRATAEAQRVAALTPQQKADQAAAADKRKAAESKSESEWHRAVGFAMLVKQSANDPKSIEFSSAGVTADGSIFIEFRGKNAFGATILNYAVLTHDGKTATGTKENISTVWNKYIAKREYRSLPIRSAGI